MGHKANPIGLRLGRKRKADLVWSTPVQSARASAHILLEDFRLRERLEKILRYLSLHSARYTTQRTRTGWLVWIFYSPLEGNLFMGRRGNSPRVQGSAVLPSLSTNEFEKAGMSAGISLLRSNTNLQRHPLSSLSFTSNYLSHTQNFVQETKKGTSQTILSHPFLQEGKGLNSFSSSFPFLSLSFPSLQGSRKNPFHAFFSEKKVSLRWVCLPSPDMSAEALASLVRSLLEKGQRIQRVFSFVEAYYETNSSIRGIRIVCSGRLHGVEMAQDQKRQYGETSLHTLSHAIDYANCSASTPYGQIGVKIWISYMI
uniref:Small ribosomal subunit protein uS3m n=1 Tax=Prasinococcus sp. CCMP1194 TaxID=110672 RepID=A0A650AKI9_9VIRI|nr:ribosomal protein S3 [Prasinococcus sp. CCMP1194]